MVDTDNNEVQEQGADQNQQPEEMTDSEDMSTKPKQEEQAAQGSKDQTAAEAGGAPPKEATQDEPEECFGRLRAHLFAYRCTDGEGEFQPEYPTISATDVTVTGEGYNQCHATDPAGWADFEEVLVGHEYRVSVPELPGYEAIADKTVAIQESGPMILEFGYVPRSATLKVTTYVDVEPGDHDLEEGKEPDRPPLDTYIDIYGDGGYIECVKASEGSGEATIECPGLLTIEARPALYQRCQVRPANNSFMVSLEPGGELELPIPFVPNLGQIQAAAFLVQEVDGKTRRTPLGATISIHPGLNTLNDPSFTIKTHGRVPATFRGLAKGHHTIAVDATATMPEMAIEAYDPPGGVRTIYLECDQRWDVLEFLFRPCLGKVSGMVVDGTCGEGLADVELVIYAADGTGQSHTTHTGPGGIFFFSQLTPDKKHIVELALPKFDLAGKTWEVEGETFHEVVASASKITQVPPFSLVPEETFIYGVVKNGQGQPRPFAKLDVFFENGDFYRATMANEYGQYRVDVPRSGKYFVGVRSAPNTQAPPSRWQLVTVNSGALLDHNIDEDPETPPPQGQPNGNLREAVADLTSYPFLTEEVGSISTATGVSGAPAAAPLGQTIERTLRDVLGWRPKVSDHKGFVAALTQSFPCQEIEGQIKCVYTPRTYAVQVQADMGAVTGAQASIYARAKTALDESLILLDRLRALDPAADVEETGAARSIVRSELTQLVNELGVEGGPRVSRVDTLFDLLRGANNPSPDPEQIQGQLRQLQEEFGLTRDQVNTIEEEQNLTDFITLVDYVNSLKQSWDAQRRFFDRSSTAEPFLGTQLVLVSRALAVVAESVQEAYFAMDSVFLGAAERQTTELTFSNSPPLFVAELLEWVDRVASEEGPQLIQDGGKAGVIALYPTINTLRTLVRDSMIPPQDPARFPESYRTARVQRTLNEMASHLDETADLAGQFVPPADR